jgi:hypothetical protein
MLILGQLRHRDALQRQYEGPWWFFCETMRSLTSRGARRIRGPRNFRLAPQKYLCNNICQKRKSAKYVVRSALYRKRRSSQCHAGPFSVLIVILFRIYINASSIRVDANTLSKKVSLTMKPPVSSRMILNSITLVISRNSTFDLARYGGLIRHRMPLRREVSPFLFGRAAGCVFGLPLAPERFHISEISQIRGCFDMRAFCHSFGKAGAQRSLSPYDAEGGAVISLRLLDETKKPMLRTRRVAETIGCSNFR